MVAVLATSLSADVRGVQSVSISLPRNVVARTFLSHIGFYAELDRRGWHADEDLEIDSDLVWNECLPVQSLATESELDEAADILHESLSSRISGNLIGNILDVAAELTNNAREHGDSRKGRSSCYVVVQAYTGRTSGTPGIWSAVADFGPGFAQTLRSYGPMNDGEAIINAFEVGVSGTGLPNRGYGLDYVRGTIESHTGAELWIFSRTAIVTRSQRGVKVETDQPEFRGTLATAYFPFPI